MVMDLVGRLLARGEAAPLEAVRCGLGFQRCFSHVCVAPYLFACWTFGNTHIN